MSSTAPVESSGLTTPPRGPGCWTIRASPRSSPEGSIAVTDDYRDRVVLIDRQTKRIVWQYGKANHPGTGPDRLKIPDGFDLLTPSGTTPTHPYTG